MLTPEQIKFWNRIAYTVIILCMITSFVAFGLDSYRYDTLPRHADPATGNIYPRNHHGIVVYETRAQMLIFSGLLYPSLGIPWLVVLVGVWKLNWPLQKRYPR